MDSPLVPEVPLDYSGYRVCVGGGGGVAYALWPPSSAGLHEGHRAPILHCASPRQFFRSPSPRTWPSFSVWWFRAKVLKLLVDRNHLEGFLKCRLLDLPLECLTESAWGGARGFAFLTIPQRMLMLFLDYTWFRVLFLHIFYPALI